MGIGTPFRTEREDLAMKYRIRLELLHRRHASDLSDAGNDPEIWWYLPGQAFRHSRDASNWIDQALVEYENGRRIPYAIINAGNGKAIGSTSLMNLRKVHRGVEIGWTWLGRAYRRNRFNTESKYLLMQHAFEAMDAVRVEIKADERNLASQRALERLGATREGVLRSHMIMPDGHTSNSVYYSVMAEEWPNLKVSLEDFLGMTTSSSMPAIVSEPADFEAKAYGLALERIEQIPALSECR